MESAPIAYLLYNRHMRYNPKNPDWAGRDRFLLSCGHASALLYSMLHLSGFGLSLDDLKNFRQIDSPTAGHPEFAHLSLSASPCLSPNQDRAHHSDYLYQSITSTFNFPRAFRPARERLTPEVRCPIY